MMAVKNTLLTKLLSIESILYNNQTLTTRGTISRVFQMIFLTVLNETIVI